MAIPTSGLQRADADRHVSTRQIAATPLRKRFWSMSCGRRMPDAKSSGQLTELRPLGAQDCDVGAAKRVRRGGPSTIVPASLRGKRGDRRVVRLT